MEKKSQAETMKYYTAQFYQLQAELAQAAGVDASAPDYWTLQSRIVAAVAKG